MGMKIFRLNTNPFAFIEKVYPDMLNGPCKVGICKDDGIRIPAIRAGNLGVRSTVIYINQAHAR
jgi:hypothetical protein